MEQSDMSYKIRFRGSGVIPWIGTVAPCTLELKYTTIEKILLTMYRRPMRLEVYYVDQNGKNWEIKYQTMKKILPKPVEKKEETKKEEKKPEPPVNETKEINPEVLGTIADMSNREMEPIVEEEHFTERPPEGVPEFFTVEEDSSKPNNPPYQNQKHNKHRH